MCPGLTGGGCLCERWGEGGRFKPCGTMLEQLLMTTVNKWAVAKNSRKFTLVFPQKRTGQVVFREDAKFADVRFRPCVSHQSLQLGAQPNFPIKFQAEP